MASSRLFPFLLLLFSVLLSLAACSPGPAASRPESMSDPHSFSRPDSVRVVHQDFSLSLDFEKNRIEGQTRVRCHNLTGSESRLQLDTRNLEILWVKGPEGPRPFSLGPEKPILGRCLSIPVPADAESELQIGYRTTTGSDALQWLSPAQTRDKSAPFLFTQGQAILSRTWFPCQDSPGVRFTWSAEVSSPWRVVMSAPEVREDTVAGKTRFVMDMAVPAYLVALASGNIGRTALTPPGTPNPVTIFAEQPVLGPAVQEFADVPAMIKAAESLYGPYRWKKYDILVLPPSFPFGGMENPCVTFATPTILAGDRSLVSLIAHELAHSWSGNLVTNATWNDFWLNEGFTVYFERRIMEEIEGKDYADMLAVTGYQDLLNTLEEMGPGNPASCLQLNLEGKDPDEGMNDVAYEKGYRFLCRLEEWAGRKKWDAFLRGYFDRNAFSSITTARFLEQLREALPEIGNDPARMAECEAWIFRPDLPEGAKVPRSARYERAGAEALQAPSGHIPAAEVCRNWSSHEWLHYLRSLPAGTGTENWARIDKALGLSERNNQEIRFEYLLRSVRLGYRSADPAVEEFLLSVGRRKFVLPLFKALVAADGNKKRARAIFSKAAAGYHAVTRQSVESLLAEP